MNRPGRYRQPKPPVPPHPFKTPEAWRDVHQPFEIAWWRKALAEGHSADDAVFDEHWKPVRDWIKPGRRVLDIGPGPRPPFAPCWAIEPLVSRYRELVPTAWWDGCIVLERPAEEVFAPWAAGFDTVICWNCLDHTIGWRQILANMADYCAHAGTVALATDVHEPFVGHPGFALDELMAEIDRHFVVRERREKWRHDLAFLLEPRWQDR